MIGTKLAHYEITTHLGSGGMGDVYQATDTKLGRNVAIKFLPEAFSHDTERVARFQREARVLASLNHPNIAAIHGLEESGERKFLVMELVEGETLADRIKRGPIPLDESLQIAKQICNALEAAHEKGVIHRDLKPANIKVAPDGTVKVLDFGLAKAFQAETSTSGLSNSPTLSMEATNAGVILGTAAYMSPEQAKGRPVDKRTDIFSFGCVLYEMLTGRRLFHGDDVTDTLAAVLRQEPDWEQLPVKVHQLLKRCLAKDPKNRLRDIGDAMPLLEGAPMEVTAARGKPARLPWAVAAALAVVAAGALFIWWRGTYPPVPPLKPLVRLDVNLGPDVSLGSPAGADAILSPDGNRLVYVSQSRLFTRRLDQPKAAELAGTEGAFAPFFSPDGQWVAFFTTAGKLKKVSVEGGAAITLRDASLGRGGSWGEDGNIIAALASSGGSLSRIPDGGGPPQPLTELAQGEVTHRWPQILPGGKAVLLTAHTATIGFDGANIEVVSLGNRRPKTLVRGGTYGRYLPTSKGSGHLVYINKGTLFAVPFDPDTLDVRGTPTPLLEGVSYSAANGAGQFDLSRGGTLVYRSGAAGGGLTTLQWLDGAGKLQPLVVKPGIYSAPHVSPDGKLVALSVGGGNGSDIWTYDWQRDAMSHLTFGDGAYSFPVWSPDGRYVVFHADSGIFWTRADGAGKPQPLTQNKQGQFPWSFSPDGKRLAFAEVSPKASQLDIWTVPVENEGGQLRSGKPEIFLSTPANELYPAFSPDGRWIAYRSFESGISEIYVRAFPDNGGKWLISNNGGIFAVWSRSGRELFYRTDDQRIMVVTYTTNGDSFVPDKPRLWSDKRLVETATSQNADIAPDGKRFAVLVPAEGQDAQQAQNHVIFLENFFDELRRRVPAGK
jgi:Tol biopolymer transport system component